jgi:hypothetical protein
MSILFPETIRGNKEVLQRGNCADICDHFRMLISKYSDYTADVLWSGSTMQCLDSVVTTCIWLRDNYKITMTPNLIAEQSLLSTMIDVANGKSTPALPSYVARVTLNYLKTIPYFNLSQAHSQPEIVIDSHAYRVAVIWEVLEREFGLDIFASYPLYRS